MNDRLNQKFIDDVIADDNFYYEALVAELESLLDAGISKSDGEIDEGFIDECCSAIEYLRSVQTGVEKANYEMIFDINALIKSHHRRAKIIYISSAACTAAAVLCAVFAMRMGSANEQNLLRQYSPGENSCKQSETCSDDITEESVNTSQPQTSECVTTIEQLGTTGQIVTESIIPSVTQPISEIYRLEVLFAPGSSATVMDISDIDLRLKGAVVKVSCTGNYEEIVPIEECQVDIGEVGEDGIVRVTVTYKLMYTNIYFKVQTTE